MSYIEMDTDLLMLAAAGDECKAKDLLRKMTPAELRDLREALSRLDGWLDDTVLERHQTKKEKR